MPNSPAPVWLEVALNGPWSRQRQPLIPITVAEIVEQGIACARAGAAIVHVHAYDEQTGIQNDDPETYARIIEGIRAVEDVIVYPTVPLTGPGEATDADGAAARYAAVEFLGERGLLEWAVVDPGSVHLTTVEDVEAGRSGILYLNPDDHLRYALTLASRYSFTPAYAIYEPGFVRLGSAAVRAAPAGTPGPVYRFMFTDQFTFGFPPEPEFLAAYLRLLTREAEGAPWMASGLGVDVVPLFDDVLQAGGHLRVGLEDAPLGTTQGNLVRVEAAAAVVEKAGRRLATPEEIRHATSGIRGTLG